MDGKLMKKKRKKDGRGGVREGAGRPAEWATPTTTISFRVPIYLAPDIKHLVKEFLLRQKNDSN
jgi:hypothetical protein